MSLPEEITFNRDITKQTKKSYCLHTRAVLSFDNNHIYKASNQKHLGIEIKM